MPARGRNQELDPINLTPLLDCILNLIFFFLLATTIKQNIQVVEVQLPQTSVSTTPPSVPKLIVVTIATDGRILLDKDVVTSAQLKTRLAEFVKQPGGSPPIRVRGDRDAHLQVFFDVLSVFRELGDIKFDFETKPPGRAP
jgi:biopolymer transport protein ExbD